MYQLWIFICINFGFLIGGHSGFLIGINETGEGFLSMLTFAWPVVSLLFDSD
jgi:hypothetical protein